MEKRHIDRRLAQMEAEGTEFRAGVNVGVDITAAQLRDDFDAVVLAGGATAGATCRSPAASWPASTRPWSTCRWPTGCSRATMLVDGRPAADHREGQEGRHHRRRRHRGGLPGYRAPSGRRRACTSSRSCRARRRSRADSTPWPTYPLMFRVSSAHEEGGERVFSVNTEQFVGEDGQVTGLKAHEVTHGRTAVREGRRLRLRPGSRPRPAGDGLRRPGEGGLLTDLGVEFTDAATSRADDDFETSVPGVFVAGDMGRGQSLIVWAIAEGRAAAAASTASCGRDCAARADQADGRALSSFRPLSHRRGR